MTKAERWTDLQTKAQAAAEAVRTYRIKLEVRYQSTYYAPAAKRRKLDQLERASDRAQERLYRYLDTLSHRNWRKCCPTRFVVKELTYADASTDGQLAVVPYPSYGRTEGDMQAFARPVTTDTEQR